MGRTGRAEQLDTDILSSVADLIGQIAAHGERLAQRFSCPGFFIKALHTLDCPMAMKELGRRAALRPVLRDRDRGRAGEARARPPRGPPR